MSCLCRVLVYDDMSVFLVMLCVEMCVKSSSTLTSVLSYAVH